jgi:hypothetical protein
VLNDFVQVAEITLPKPPPRTSFVVTPDGSGGTTIGLAPSKGHVLQDVLGKLEYKISQLLPPHAAEVLKDVVEKLQTNSPTCRPGFTTGTAPPPTCRTKSTPATPASTTPPVGIR